MGAKSGKIARAMKWVGYAAAVLSLGAGVSGIVKVARDRTREQRRVDVLISTEAAQLRGKDYWSASRSLEQAAQIDPDSARVRAAQETVAMEWLENIRVTENEKFSDIAEKLEPVLTRGGQAAKSPSEQADLLAHVGWSYFLRHREGRFGLDPAGPYADAVKKDPSNPYAQAMWGHWILWNHGSLAEAQQHFAKALESPRQRAYVRQLQLAALMNSHEDRFEEETIRVADAIRKEQGEIDPAMRSRIFSIYYARLLQPHDEKSTRFLYAVLPADHLATFRWLSDRLELDEGGRRLRSYYLSALEEVDGQKDEALEGFRQIERQTRELPGSLRDGAQAGIARLTGKTGQ